MATPIYRVPCQTACTYSKNYVDISPGRRHFSLKYLFPSKPITYSTPPYMTVLENVVIVRFPVRRRKLMDMIKKFDPNDISYITEYESRIIRVNPQPQPVSVREKFVLNGDKRKLKFSQDISYIKGYESRIIRVNPQPQPTSIREKFVLNDFSLIRDTERIIGINLPTTSMQDQSNRKFVVNGDILMSKFLVGSNDDIERMQAKFIIRIHRQRVSPRTAVTVKVDNKDLYLSYTPSEDRGLKLVPLGQMTLDLTNPEARPFFFFITDTSNSKHSFESAAELDCFISTSTQKNDRVTVQPKSQQNTYYMDFTFDSGNNNSVGNGFEFAQKPSINDWIDYFNERIFHEMDESIIEERDFEMFGNEMTSKLASSSTLPGQLFRYQRNCRRPQLT
ncbi:uncharacterized protein LOC142149878 isoform X2 [Mixophyes fleayi]|uniref:uncharacterized protein LOC142149878 isoform X2 n=1 Tax=Mixophyes fleayi TaxID=3061075 RepID=UPI003F4E32C9